VGAFLSAVPQWQPHTLAICVMTLAAISVVNLRGVRETGAAFLIPTYLFVFCLSVMIGLGVIKTIASGGHPLPVDHPAKLVGTEATASLWLLMRAFASGCTAMTGVEAVSNGVAAFREPRIETARKTLTIVIGILIVLLAGIAYLCRAYRIGATPP